MQRFSRTATRRSALMAVAATVLLAASIFPARALADESTDAMAYSEDAAGSRTYYTSIDEAMSAGYGGAVIYLNRDWQLSGSLVVEGGKTISLSMNGHKIVGDGKSTVIDEKEHANLTLMSDTSAQLSYTGYDADGNAGDCTLTSGGLVTGGHGGDSGGGIAMGNHSNLTLSNVAVAGNYSTCGGGVKVGEGCTLAMKQKATITHNRAAGGGGGVILSGKKTDERGVVTMDDSSINENVATSGGGVRSDADGTDIRMENNSAISDNKASCIGGGVFFAYTHFNIESADRTGSVSGNQSASTSGGAGGIYVEDVSMQTHHGTIVGLNIKDNHASGDGGGVLIYQNYTYVTDCTLTGNSADKDAGGVGVVSNNCAITSSTITGNYCNGNGTYYEGGGVHVNQNYDLTLSGKCTITDNTRGKGGSADNVFLANSCGSQAYILGGVDEGSQVGIRTGNTDDSQMIGKNISTYTEGTYSMDLPAYRLTHGTDHNGDLWQRKA